MKRILSFLIIIGLIAYGVYILVNYVQVIMRKKGLEEKAKETLEYLYSGTITLDKARNDIITHITDNNINVDTAYLMIDKNPQFSYIYVSYYDSLVFPFFKKSKVIYFDYEIAETLYVK